MKEQMIITSPSVRIHDSCKKFQIDEQDLDHIQAVGEVIIPDIEWVMDAFYLWMEKQEFYEQYFFNEQLAKHIKEKQIEYWKTFFKAEITEDYITQRKQLGKIHAQVGLSVELYYRATSVIQNLFKKVLEKNAVRNDQYLWSLMKYMNWDFSMVCAAEAKASSSMLERMLTKQTKTLEDMSTPITALWEGILLLAIIGKLTAQRAKKILEDVLLNIKDYQSKVLIIDLSAVASLNGATAQYFIHIAKAAQLMGCSCNLTGINAKTAQILLELDLDVDQLNTTGSLVHSLNNALRLCGKKIVSL